MTLSRILSADPEIDVVGLAPEPHVARDMIKDLNPDVLTLDVEMPGMDGLSFLEKIMRLRPMPVVMCSTLTARGAEVSIEALRLGAVDCIAKPSGNPLEIVRDADHLRTTVKAAAKSRVRSKQPTKPKRPVGAAQYRDAVIAIGSSTGGVEALFSVISALPADCPPVLIVQHMPAAFTAGFAARLNSVAAVRVVEARDGEPIERGTVYIAPGGAKHMQLLQGSPDRIKLVAKDPVGGHRPAVDVLFQSVSQRGEAAIGVILTGMGSDGAAGLLAMREAGARTFGQDEATCVVYGMPRAAFELGAVERQVNLSAVPEAVLDACKR
jgi:two-component system chemotaxis response regulator CheB